MSNGTQVIPFAERIGALTAGDVREQVNLIQGIMREVMKKDEHYGVIPGTGTKPSLLKAGAEKLCLTFRLAPDYEVQESHQGSHLRITSKCILTHIPSGQRFGAGMGSCSTLESKYAYRSMNRTCPACGAEAIIKGKEQYGGGWICFKKKGGCGAKFVDDAPEIKQQITGRIANEDLADQYNTVLKMANKRSLVAAVLNSTAASDIFTQDIEDMPRNGGGAEVLDAEVIEAEAEAQHVMKVSPEQAEAIDVALSQNDVPLADFLRSAKVASVRDLEQSRAVGAIDWIREQRTKREGLAAAKKKPAGAAAGATAGGGT